MKRSAFLANLRRAMGVEAGDIARQRRVSDRIRLAPVGVVPGRGQLPASERLALFESMASRALASVVMVPDVAAVPGAVADYLRSHKLPMEVRMGGDPRLQHMHWMSEPLLAAWLGPAEPTDPVGISHAEAGIAETGTLLLASGPENPTTLAFLPETHVVAVAATDIVGDYETALAIVRQRSGGAFPPRSMNMITGPSRSADIEQTMLLGAHGPRRLHIIITGAGYMAA